VAPFKAVLGLGYGAPRDAWGAELLWTGVARKDRLPPPDQTSSEGNGATTLFASPGYGSLDLLTHWNPVKCVRVQAGLLQRFQSEVLALGGCAGLREGDPALPRYSQPGRNFSLGRDLQLEVIRTTLPCPRSRRCPWPRRRNFGEARHGHDVARVGHHEARASAQLDVTYGHGEVAGPATQCGVRREGILGLGHADGGVAPSRSLVVL